MFFCILSKFNFFIKFLNVKSFNVCFLKVSSFFSKLSAFKLITEKKFLLFFNLKLFLYSPLAELFFVKKLKFELYLEESLFLLVDSFVESNLTFESVVLKKFEKLIAFVLEFNIFLLLADISLNL